MKKRLMALLLAVLVGAAVTVRAQEQTGIIWTECAQIYADVALTQPVAEVEKYSAVTYDEVDGSLVSVRYDGVSGYMPRAYIGVPGTGEWRGYDSGAVLCQSLSLRVLPDSASKRIGELAEGERFVILAEQDGFYLACRRSENGEYDENGWVNAEYVAKNKGMLTTDALVHARAFADESAPLVAEISEDTTLNCIAMTGEYYVVSLRAASAFIHTSEPVTLDGQARTALGRE